VSPAPTRHGWRSALTALLFASITACGGSDSSGPTPPPSTPGSLGVSLASFPASVIAGSQATIGITITRGGSFTGAVSLAVEGAPAGVTANLSATSLAAGVTTATLTLQVSATVAAGSYPITVRATGTGVSAASATSALLVTAAALPSFSLSAAPTAISVVAGQQGTSTLTIARAAGFTGSVTLVAEGAPAGVTASFSASPVTGTSSTLTFTVSAATAAGTYPITVRGSGSGVAERTATVTLTVTEAANFAVTLAPASASIVAGGSVDVTVNIARTGGFAGAVEFVTSALPAGVVATFSPRSTTAASTTVQLRSTTLTPLGTYEIILRGTGAGVGDRQATFTLTVRAGGDFALAVTPAAATVTAGSSTSPTVTITRAGDFTGTVTLSATGAPAGTTVSFSPAAVTGAVATVTITTTAGTAAGTYPITIRGNTPGLEERTTTVALTIQSGGGTGNVTWRFCNTDRFPLWFAYQDGTSGAWNRVLPGANQTYSVTISSTRGGVAYVNRESGANADVVIFFTSREELQQLGQAECTTNPARKSLNGLVAGLGLGQTAQISVGGGSASAGTNGPFTVSNVNDGAVDLLAVRNSIDLGTSSIIPDRLILRRALNLPNNATIPPLDFGGAEAFAPATAAITAENAGSDQVAMVSSFVSEAGGFTGALFTAITGGATRTLYGVPFARTQAGDLHQIGVIATAGATSARGVYQYNREFIARTLTLGPALATPTVSSLGATPYPRLRAAGLFQVEYGQGIGVTYTQTTGGGRNWSVTATPAWFGNASSYQLDLPDLTSANGFDTAWALVAGATTTWSVSASRIENAPIGVFVENFRLLQASRSGAITP
jgi:uncharacterized membrane protein